MHKNQYILLAIFVFISLLIIPLFLPSGGFGSDITSYISLAYQFPEIKWSLFPIGYPLLLKFFNVFTNDYYWAGRLINIFGYLAIVLFSFYNKFYFKETVILLSTKFFFHQFFFSSSEGPLLVLMYFLFYYLYVIVNNDRMKVSWLFLPASLIMIAMFLVRYSAIYIYGAILIFYPYYFHKKKDLSVFRNNYFYFLVFSILGILGYVFFNYYHFGDFMGESYRGGSNLKFFDKDFYMTLLALMHSFNPIIFIRPLNITKVTLAVHVVMFLMNIFFIYIIVKIWKTTIKTNNDLFFILVIFIGFFYEVMMFVSVFFQNIWVLEVRLLCEASFCFFYAAIFLYYRAGFREKYIYFIAVSALVLNSLYFMKSPVNFLKMKDEIKYQYSSMKGKKYFYNDTRYSVKPIVYQIPIINKKIIYAHPESDLGIVRGAVLITINPDIIFLYKEKDAIKNKPNVIFSSDFEK